MRILFFTLIWSTLTSACFANATLDRLGRSLFQPWGMSLHNDGQVLATERRGKIFRINLTDGQRHKIGNVLKLLQKTGVLNILVQARNQSDPVVFSAKVVQRTKGPQLP